MISDRRLSLGGFAAACLYLGITLWGGMAMAAEEQDDDLYWFAPGEYQGLLAGNSLIYAGEADGPFAWFFRPDGTGLRLDGGRVEEVCWGTGFRTFLCIWNPDWDYEAHPCWRLARWTGEDGQVNYSVGFPGYFTREPVARLEPGDPLGLEERFEGPRSLTPALCGRLDLEGDQ